MTLANKITFLRILLIPVFLFLLFSKRSDPLGPYLAASVFTIAALTDTVDGLVARLQRRITALGQFLDPLADKLLISAALVALVNIDLLAPWVAMTIIIREVLVSLLRVYASARGKAIPASFFGKLKTVAQIAAVVALILDPSLFVLGKSLAWVIMAVAVVLTIFSGGEFLVALPRTLRSPTKAHS